jgi:hypothetical protein
VIRYQKKRNPGLRFLVFLRGRKNRKNRFPKRKRNLKKLRLFSQKINHPKEKPKMKCRRRKQKNW